MPYEQAYFVVNTISYFIALGTFSLIAKARGRHLRHRIVYYDTYAIFILNPNLQFILPYDLPPLAFEQICCLLVLRRRWALLGVVFALATLNGETDFLIILFLAARAWTGSEDRRTGLVVGSSQEFGGRSN